MCAKLCAGVRLRCSPCAMGLFCVRAWGRGVSLEARVFEPKFVGVGPSGPVRLSRLGRVLSVVYKKVWFCRNLLASRHPATEEVCFCRVFVPQYMIFLQVALFMRIMIFYKIWWGTLIYENLMTNDIQKPRRATFSLCFLLFCVFFAIFETSWKWRSCIIKKHEIIHRKLMI